MKIETIIQIGTKEYGWLVDNLQNKVLDIEIDEIKETVPIIIDLVTDTITYKDVISIIGNTKMTGELKIYSIETIIEFYLSCQPTIKNIEEIGTWLVERYPGYEEYINQVTDTLTKEKYNKEVGELQIKRFIGTETRYIVFGCWDKDTKFILDVLELDTNEDPINRITEYVTEYLPTEDIKQVEYIILNPAVVGQVQNTLDHISEYKKRSPMYLTLWYMCKEFSI